MAWSRRSGPNALANLAIVGSLLWWRPRQAARTLLPAERFGQAVLAGLRYGPA